MENNMRELDLNQMEQVLGGYHCAINTGTTDDAAFRKEGRKDARQIGHLPNGTIVDVDASTLTFDDKSNRHFVQVTVNGQTGWIAASFVGLKR
jgi:hypothetical protein